MLSLKKHLSRNLTHCSPPAYTSYMVNSVMATSLGRIHRQGGHRNEWELSGRTTSGRTKRLSGINRRMTTLLRYSGTGGRRDTLNYIGSNMTVSLPSFGILLDLHQGKTHPCVITAKSGQWSHSKTTVLVLLSCFANKSCSPLFQNALN